MINLTLKRAVAIAMLAGASVVANAATQDVGTVKLDIPTTFQGSILGNSSTSLNDVISFHTAANVAGAGVSVMDFPLTLPSGTLGLSLATVSLSSAGADGIIGDSDDKMLKASVFSDVGNTNGHISFSVSEPLSASTLYYVNVTGVTSGSLGGAYSGAIQLNSAPIPEPETYAMLLAGLGLMGAVVRRRSTRKTS
jgi:hypothetical protein